MTKRVLFEKDFSKREGLQNLAKDLGIEVFPCFSYEKLTFMKNKFKDEEFIILVRKDDEDIDLIKESFSMVLPIDPKCLTESFEKALEESKQIVFGYQKSGRYSLDLLCIGSSTGGLPIIQKTLKGIPRKNTIVIICQHINEQHNNSIFDTLSKGMSGNIELVSDSTILKNGYTYVLSGGTDYEVRLKYGKLYLEPVGLTSEDYHPSFNTLTGSLTKLKGLRLGCMILSGLGNDGAKHLKELHENQVRIVAQDPSIAIAPYMPKAAISTGFVDHVYNDQALHEYLKRSAA